MKRAVDCSWCAVLLVLTATAPAAQSARPRETGRVDAARLMRDVESLSAPGDGRAPQRNAGQQTGTGLHRRSVQGDRPRAAERRLRAEVFLQEDHARTACRSSRRHQPDGARRVARPSATATSWSRAHYDHLGVRGGQVYRGADDNASGVAAMLAAARWFQCAPTAAVAAVRRVRRRGGRAAGRAALRRASAGAARSHLDGREPGHGRTRRQERPVRRGHASLSGAEADRRGRGQGTVDHRHASATTSRASRRARTGRSRPITGRSTPPACRSSTSASRIIPTTTSPSDTADKIPRAVLRRSGGDGAEHGAAAGGCERRGRRRRASRSEEER